jgi:hypothetical protein
MLFQNLFSQPENYHGMKTIFVCLSDFTRTLLAIANLPEVAWKSTGRQRSPLLHRFTIPNQSPLETKRADHLGRVIAHGYRDRADSSNYR